jgi:hypothetical protein
MSRTVDSLIASIREDTLPSSTPVLVDFEFPNCGIDELDSVWLTALKETWLNLTHRYGIERYGDSEWERVQRAPSGEEDNRRTRDAAELAADAMHDAVCFGGGGIYKLVESVLEWAEAQAGGPTNLMGGSGLVYVNASRRVLAPSWRRPPAAPQPCATCGNNPWEDPPCGCPPAPPRAGAPTRCHTCGARTSQVCAQCRQRHYCGKACQMADWRAGHKRACRTAAAGGAASAASGGP